jgi:HSP20 family protein
MQDEMSRLFNDDRLFRAGESVGWTPACDIYEDEEGVSLRFELAGVDPKDVDVRFENGVLTVKGERKLEREDKRENYHRVERSYGTFTRSFSLPGTLDPERIKAETKHGVLTIVLPKKAEARPRAIQVKVT